MTNWQIMSANMTSKRYILTIKTNALIWIMTKRVAVYWEGWLFYSQVLTICLPLFYLGYVSKSSFNFSSNSKFRSNGHYMLKIIGVFHLLNCDYWHWFQLFELRPYILVNLFIHNWAITEVKVNLKSFFHSS